MEHVLKNANLVLLAEPNKVVNLIPYGMDKLRGVKTFGVAYNKN